MCALEVSDTPAGQFWQGHRTTSDDKYCQLHCKSVAVLYTCTAEWVKVFFLQFKPLPPVPASPSVVTDPATTKGRDSEGSLLEAASARSGRSSLDPCSPGVRRPRDNHKYSLGNGSRVAPEHDDQRFNLKTGDGHNRRDSHVDEQMLQNYADEFKRRFGNSDLDKCLSTGPYLYCTYVLTLYVSPDPAVVSRMFWLSQTSEILCM